MVHCVLLIGTRSVVICIFKTLLLVVVIVNYTLKGDHMLHNCYAGESQLFSNQSTPRGSGSVSSELTGKLKAWAYNNLQK
jgi:hypothetical protein